MTSLRHSDSISSGPIAHIEYGPPLPLPVSYHTTKPSGITNETEQIRCLQHLAGS